MGRVYASRVADTSQTIGAGPIGVSGIPPQANLRTFSNVLNLGNSIYVAVVNRNAAEWEEAEYVYSAINQLSALSVFKSSNNGSKVSFSSGTKDVFATFPALIGQAADRGASGGFGIGLLDFGAAPGAGSAALVVSAPTVTTTSVVNAWVVAQATADHTVDEHWLDPPFICAGNIVVGASLTVFGRTRIDIFGGGGKKLLKPFGKWTVGWSWR